MEAPNEDDVVPPLRNRIPHLLSGIINAVVSGNLDRLRELVEAGQSVRCFYTLGNTLLHIAALFWTEEHTLLLAYLLSLDEVEKDARNSKGETPLLLCTKKKLKTPAQMLINAGADVSIADQNGCTPLNYSVRYNPEVSHQLIRAGADINHKGNNSETPIHSAIRDLGDLEIVCMLLYYGADTSIRTADHHMTPFMLSLEKSMTEIALVLFEYVTDFNLKTRDNWSTLFLAVRSGFSRIIDMCERGANINYDGNPDLNIFNLGRIPKPEIFSYLWPRFNCADWPESAHTVLTYFGRDHSLKHKEVVEIIQTLFMNDDLEKTKFLIDYLSRAPAIYFVVDKLHDARESKEMVHTVVACMLMCNVVVHEIDLDMVYEHYGYCKAFKLLLYMDIQPNPPHCPKVNVFPSLIYKISWHHEFESFILRTYINDGCSDETLRLDLVDYDRIFGYLWCPNLKRKAISLCLEELEVVEDRMLHCLVSYLLEIPDVPRLLELARNKLRDMICEKSEIRTSCMFYTILKKSGLDKFIRKMIAFKTPLYVKHVEQNHSELKEYLVRRRTYATCFFQL